MRHGLPFMLCAPFLSKLPTSHFPVSAFAFAFALVAGGVLGVLGRPKGGFYLASW
jgi:hypothetical protein